MDIVVADDDRDPADALERFVSQPRITVLGRGLRQEIGPGRRDLFTSAVAERLGLPDQGTVAQGDGEGLVEGQKRSLARHGRAGGSQQEKGIQKGGESDHRVYLEGGPFM